MYVPVSPLMICSDAHASAVVVFLDSNYPRHARPPVFSLRPIRACGLLQQDTIIASICINLYPWCGYKRRGASAPVVHSAKMRASFVICACILAVVASVAAAPQNSGRKYNDKYDHIDVDSILRNDRILSSYIKCMLDQGPCTAEGKNLKGEAQ
ncbi:Hypothetical predicted protein [Cloeon dipterum]|uniref:Uncharacterized protein n=1 Tax=Cloeon dipterum TaxID=197152 RepID=A0A8S1CRV2_9INSE|nr:Hypothetical predicted protein [Cloeon dipterum]